MTDTHCTGCLQVNCSEYIRNDQWPQICLHHVWGMMLEAYHELHPKPKSITELKEALQVI